MAVPIFFILFFSSLIGGLSVLLSVRLGLSKFDVKDLVDNLDFSKEAGPLIDDKLDHMIDGFKAQIPMVAMFLNGPLAENVKRVAKEELIKALPEIKKGVLEKMDLNQKIQSTVEKQLMPLYLFGVVVGLVIGLIEAIVLFPYLR